MLEKESASHHTLSVHFQAKQTTLTFLVQICPKMDLGLEIQKTNIRIRLIILEILCVSIFRQNGQLSLFWPNFAQKSILGQNFKNLNVDTMCTSRYHVCQFLGKTDNFESFHLNFGKLPNYMWYFGSNNADGVAKNSVEAKMSWVEVGTRFTNSLKFIKYTSTATLWQKNSFVEEETFKNCSIDYIVKV